MCGILCEICKGSILEHSKVINDNKILQSIKNRGPDSINTISFKVSNDTTITFCSSVLWMQGSQLTQQPIEDNDGILIYNGDIFDETWDKNISDTKLILSKLNHSEKLLENEKHEGILRTLKSLKGPFSLIYYDKILCKLYFTRDRMGRNSLLFHDNKLSFVISSVLSRKYKSYELPASHIHILNLNESTISQHSWEDSTENTYCIENWLTILEVRSTLRDEEFKITYDIDENLKDEENIINFIQVTAMENRDSISIMLKLLDNSIINNTVIKLTELLERSVRLRLETQPQRCKDCIHLKIPSCHHCTIGILFSGGLDCTILAFLADKFIYKDQPIDLINVAFNKDHNSQYNVPDRLTGEQSYKELCRICPERKWIFRKVNVPLQELEREREQSIPDLIWPRQTILDENIGSALWFAARAQDDNSSSPCRILILGSGADELFGGYTRHRNAFKRQGWIGLQKELMLDWKRISFRNLARDNRVICDHGRQSRIPYLDEDFTDYVLRLKPWLRCFPSEHLGPGLGDKLMLRLLAFKLGLEKVSAFPKRALQFGSRIANKKDKGSDISQYFLK